MTDYDGYDLEQLWQMVDTARQGLPPSHDQVAALDRAQQMLSGHAEALEEVRGQLAAKWPPEANAASAAYLTELDRLIAAVRDTALTCAVNVFHINTVTDAIVQTHDVLAPLHTEFLANKGALAQYEAEVEAFGAGASVIPGGRTIATGAARLFTSPPVGDGRQEELTRRAQQVMVPLAGAAQDGATYIRPPAPYVAPAVAGDFERLTEIPSGGRSTGGGAIPPPVIGAPAHASRQADDSAAVVPPQETGPILSGVTPADPSIAAPTGPGQAVALPGAGSGVLGGAFPGGSGPPSGAGSRLSLEGRGPSGTGRSPAAGGGAIIGRVPRIAGSTESVQSRMNPPGGVIGTRPGSTREAITQAPGRAISGPAGNGRPTSSQGAGGRRMGAHSPGGQASPALETSSKAAAGRTKGTRTTDRNGSGALSSQAGRCARRGAAAEHQPWDPDNPWRTDEGVDPVITPEPAPDRHDPGPGIIGLNQ